MAGPAVGGISAGRGHFGDGCVPGRPEPPIRRSAHAGLSAHLRFVDNQAGFRADTSDMPRTPLAFLRRRALAGFGLALFLIGINWCLIGAMVPAAGAGMRCMPPVAVHDADDAPSAAHTGHCAGMGGESDEGTSAGAPAPCCISLAPASAPDVGKVAPALIALLDLPAATPAPAAVPQRTNELLRAPPESPSHLAAPRAHTSPRAPPTA